MDHNLPIGKVNVIAFSDQGGRQRWKIENQGFDMQKKHGYALEHAYSENETAAKNFYFLLQLARALNQWMIHGTLRDCFAEMVVSWRNYFRRMAEALRWVPMGFDPWNPAALPAFQIRFDSS